MNPEMRKVERVTTSPRLVTTLRRGSVTGAVRTLSIASFSSSLSSRRRRPRRKLSVGMMKTIGLIGGMSWESSAQYYAIINRAVRERLGGSHSARILMHSLDFGEIEKLQHDGDWSSLTIQIVDVAKRVQAGGAD